MPEYIIKKKSSYRIMMKDGSRFSSNKYSSKRKLKQLIKEDLVKNSPLYNRLLNSLNKLR
jgi:hypothetical protein